MAYSTDSGIIKAVKTRNKYLWSEVGKEDLRLEIKYRKRTRNPLNSQVVSLKLWRVLMEQEYVHVDLQQVRVADQSPLFQCSGCLSYGHTKRLCTEKTCRHGGGPHLREKCIEWLTGDALSCKNCAIAKLEHKDHNAFSADCPVRRKWNALARSTIASCCVDPRRAQEPNWQ